MSESGQGLSIRTDEAPRVVGYHQHSVYEDFGGEKEGIAPGARTHVRGALGAVQHFLGDSKSSSKELSIDCRRRHTSRRVEPRQ